MKKIVYVLAVLLTLAILFLVYKSRRPAQTIPGQVNILLITIDTLRPDRLSCYGSTNPTPHLDEIARNGIQFQHAFTHVPLTFPSHASILTGLFPVHHGMHQNGRDILQNSSSLISSVLQQNGYKTGAVVSSFVLDRKFGLEKAFHTYDDVMERAPGTTSNFDVERPGDQTLNATMKVIDSFSGSKWFVWTHFYDPHTPYAPPPPLQGYDGEVQFVDEQIGKLMDWLKSKNLDRNLIVVVTGDHGESLGEHGEQTHGFFVYNSTLHVPLILSFPGVHPKKMETAVGTADIVPTLLALTGIADTQDRDGESMLPLLHGEKRSKDLYFESHYAELLGWNGLSGILQNNWKLISTTRSELYDWQNDSMETTNVYSQKIDTSQAMQRELGKLTSTAVAQTASADSETLEKLKSLGYIGTTNAIKPNRDADPKDKITVWAEYEKSLQLKSAGNTTASLVALSTLVDHEPRNNFFRVTLASNLRQAGNPQSAIEHLKTAIENEPADADAYHELAVSYKELHEYGEAMKAEEAALALHPERSELHSVKGMILVETGRFEQAKQEFSLVLHIDPNNAVAWNNLGNAQRETNELDLAADSYRKAISLSPHYAYPLNGLATVLIRKNQVDDAIPYLEKALTLDPKFVEVLLNLGIAYQIQGNREKAKTAYETFLKVAPDWMAQERSNAKLLLSQVQ